MSTDQAGPAGLHHLLPLGSENQWSDLLATLVETDPGPFLALADIAAAQKPGTDVAATTTTAAAPVARTGAVTVRRESRTGDRDRLDLFVDVAGSLAVAIEVKVLSGLGPRQLERYDDQLRQGIRRCVVFPERLALDLGCQPGWLGLTWEQIFDAYRASANPWVAQTAAAAREHLDRSMPHVSAETVWNALPEGSGFVIGLRARMTWVFQHLEPPEWLNIDLVGSHAGVSWVARMHAGSSIRDHLVLAEVEERLPVRDWPKQAGSGRPVVGPSVKVGLLHEAWTSAGFAWRHLSAYWPLMAAARRDWVTRSARPRAAVDKENWKAVVGAGAPPWLGVGYGDNEARRHGACVFAARFQLPPTVRLTEVAETMNSLVPLLDQMRTLPPTP